MQHCFCYQNIGRVFPIRRYLYLEYSRNIQKVKSQNVNIAINFLFNFSNLNVERFKVKTTLNLDRFWSPIFCVMIYLEKRSDIGRTTVLSPPNILVRDSYLYNRTRYLKI